MAKLIYSLAHQDPKEIDLSSDREYVIGRDESCDIVLEAYKGVSRKHIKLSCSTGEWRVEKLSSHGEFPSGDLTNNSQFKIGPYDFEFQLQFEPKEANRALSLEHSRTLALKSSDSPNAPTGPEAHEGTVVGVRRLTPYLKIEWPDRASPEVFQLKGEKWILGRDPKCDIPIDYAEMSRHHFEISMDGQKVFVQDIGSSNGTLLNSEALHPRIPVLLNSGDCLQVQEMRIYFEWRDPNFHALVPTFQNPHEAHNSLAAPMVLMISEGGQAVEQLGKPGRFNKQTTIRVGLVMALLVVLAIGFLLPEKEEQALSSKTGPDQGISASQKAAARDSFQLALHLYKQGKYELCMSELHKLHQIMPQFENSKELEVFCSHGHELVLRQKDRERKEREQQAIRQQIATVIAQCRQILKPFDAPEKHVQCLTPATELDPENSDIQQIIRTAQEFEKQRTDQRRFAAARAEKILAGRKHFEKAMKLKQQGNLKVALLEYQSFLKNDYPVGDEQKEIAQREIAGIKKEISERIQSRLELCTQAAAKNQWKIGYQSCDEVLKEDPGNVKARQERDRMLSELRREMKAIYEDSVLEESLGNVDTAKEKWKKITEENLSFEDYTKKAKQKLRKYGIGM